MISKVTYLGDLRTECEHLGSGSKIITDAPLDNEGKGGSFSPTDTVATALASCMFTIIGIKARDHELNVEGAFAEITKTMASDPRRISGIKVVIIFPAAYSQKEQIILERAARTCPVLYSLHPDIDLEISFVYP
ncbi:OsmC family protein [Salinimicrobium flavum]|uniref:OsmC family protein n=1 Tax=Salinimicrobium flavum TaxID=1737065 RepID=A0ABW5ITK6_9FLAO